MKKFRRGDWPFDECPSCWDIKMQNNCACPRRPGTFVYRRPDRSPMLWQICLVAVLSLLYLAMLIGIVERFAI